MDCLEYNLLCDKTNDAFIPEMYKNWRGPNTPDSIGDHTQEMYLLSPQNTQLVGLKGA